MLINSIVIPRCTRCGARVAITYLMVKNSTHKRCFKCKTTFVFDNALRNRARQIDKIDTILKSASRRF